MTTFQKIFEIDWVLVILLCMLSAVGLSMLYSVSGGEFEPWTLKQGLRYVLALCVMFFVAVIDIRVWYKATWGIFFACLVLLLAVEVFGVVGMGAKRWIDLKFMKVQPSELMKIAVILATAKFYNGLNTQQVSTLLNIVRVSFLLLVPAYLVFRQPDLGTAILIVAGGIGVGFVAGISWRWFIAGGASIAIIAPLIWSVVLRPYQKKRVLTFLNPEADPLGNGYHIIQSKIAIGSGGMMGRGFMQGTQSNLDFLPEKHTDFIFSVIAEELGFVGAVSVLLLVLLILFKTMVIAINSASKFGKFVAIGMGITFFLYVFINAGMVMGLLPVVGVPFPLLSYGGTVMMTIMAAFGLVQNVHIHRHIEYAELDSYK